MVVRVNECVRALGSAEELGRAVRQHLVRVHVVRRAGARLIHVDDELIAERAGENFVGGRADGVRDVRLQAAQRGVRFGGGFFDEDRRDDQIVGRAKTADREVVDRARGLYAVVRIGGNLELAKRIAFGAEGHESLKCEV